MKYKCEVVSSSRKYGRCGKVARFKIVDFECGNEDGEYVKFWVCNDCMPHFIEENEDNPHCIILEEITAKTGRKDGGEIIWVG